jgi:hypothetical protein
VAATWLIAEIAMQHAMAPLIFFADDFLLGTMGQWFRHIAAGKFLKIGFTPRSQKLTETS